MKKNVYCLYAILIVSSFFPFTAFSRSVSGTGIIRISAPVNNEIKDRSYAAAAGYFKVDCIEWLKEETGITVDTLNAVWKYHLSTFVGNCLQKAKQDASLDGHDWKVTLSLSSEDAQTTLKEYNSGCQAQSTQIWTTFKSAIENNTGDVFKLGVQAIFFSMGRLEKTLDVPGSEEPGSFLVDDARKIMQEFVNKITISSPSFVISGKAGSDLNEPLVLKIKHDTLPIAGLKILASTPSGKKLFSGTTDSNGVFTISNLKIPFVSKGTFMYLEPDFGALVNGVCTFSAADIGLKFPEQTFLFNTVSPSFLIDYKVTAANAIEIPKNFSGNEFIKKYLRDSCFLSLAQGDNADMFFTVITQVSSYSSDSTEKTVYKVDNSVTIKDASGKVIAEKTALVLEKAYETSSKYSLGLYFWEAAGKSYHMIRQMLDDM